MKKQNLNLEIAILSEKDKSESSRNFKIHYFDTLEKGHLNMGHLNMIDSLDKFPQKHSLLLMNNVNVQSQGILKMLTKKYISQFSYNLKIQELHGLYPSEKSATSTPCHILSL